MRTFIALNLPVPQREALREALLPMQEKQLPVRWANAEGLHLTLKFLGEIESGQVAPLGAALERVAAQHSPLQLRLGGFGAFPSLRRASVLWVGVEPNPELHALQRELEGALLALGYAREQRPFRAHITVARTRAGGREPDVSRFTDTFDFKTSAAVETIDLMRSHTAPTGARYELLLKAQLKGAA